MCVSPCRVFAENGIYYLLGEDNTSGSGGGIVFLRINLMRNIQIEEQARYRIYKVIVEGLSTRNLAKRRFKTITGEDIEITFRFSSSIATETADYFGYKRMIFMPGGDEEHYTARIRMPGKAMLRYALMYAPDVEILAPQDLREQAAAVFRQAADVYGEG